MKDLTNKVALVTGGATGIGRGVTERLAAAGASVAIVGPEASALEAQSSVLKERGCRTAWYVADVRDVGQVGRAVLGCVSEFGSVDILVNNAGVFPNRAALDMTEEEWDSVVDTNLKGTFFCSQAVAREMVRLKTGGRIINISSTAAKIARPGIAHYGSSKAAISHLTAILAVEWGRSGITVNCVAPGIIATEQVQIQMASPEGSAEYESRRGRIPLGDFGAVADVAEAVLWLASPGAAYCTGAVLTVDGGYSLGVTSYK